MDVNPLCLWSRAFDDIPKNKGDTEAANRYFSVRNFRFLRKEVLRLLGDVRQKAVLDVGCGTGHFAQPLAGKNFVAGVDISWEMTRFARNKSLAAVMASAERLPFEEGCFDIVLANSVIQLIPAGETFIRELVRVAKPGGRVIISTINAGNAALVVLRLVEKEKYKQFRLYPFSELKELVNTAGGKVRTSLFLYFPFRKTKVLPGDRNPGTCARRLATSVVVDAFRLHD
jgi:ubiquinone/menaquinone biosynthesis C-methylase UbiE